MGDFKDKVNKFRDDMDDSYNRSAGQYSRMSDERLQKEIKNQFSRNNSADKWGKINALKDEYDSRRDN